MSSISEFLYSIADEMGRPRDSLGPVIKIFEENWYDTKESLRGIDDAAFDQMKVPRRLVDIIKSKLNPSGAVTQGKPTTQDKPDPELQMNMIDFKPYLEEIKKESITQERFQESLEVFDKVTMNIVQNPEKEQFRTLKINSNKKLQAALKYYPSALALIKEIGFEEKDGVFVLNMKKYNPTTFKQLNLKTQEYLQDLESRPVFNPYQSSFSSTGDLNMAKFTQNSGTDLGSYPEKLDELKRMREERIKPLIENKEPQLIIVKQNQSLSDAIDNDAEEDTNTSDDPIFREMMLKWAKSIEESMNFSSKRRKEYQDLIKKPLFTESKIRIKFPNNTILEGKFSPKETLRDVLNFVTNHLKDKSWNFYIYQSPPVERVTEKALKLTLEQYECVPTGFFHFALEDKDLEAKIDEYTILKPNQQ